MLCGRLERLTLRRGGDELEGVEAELLGGHLWCAAGSSAGTCQVRLQPGCACARAQGRARAGWLRPPRRAARTRLPACSALPTRLARLKLELLAASPLLTATIECDVDPRAVSLHVANPSAAMWLPQLQACALHVHTTTQMQQLAAALEGADAVALRMLHLTDERPAPACIAAPATLPALAELPQLDSLVSLDWAGRPWGARHVAHRGHPS